MNFTQLLKLYSRRNPIIFDKKQNFIFIPNNKVAQTSIVRNILKDRCVVKKDNSLKWHFFFLLALRDCYYKRNIIYTFTVVRNPYAMVFSAYDYLKYKLRKDKLSKYDDFNEFIEKLLSKEREKVDPHFLPQSDSLIYKNKTLPIHVYYLETLNESWKELLEKIKEPYQELPQAHKNISSTTSYKDSYNKQSYKIVNELFKSDFEIFGYKK